MTTTTRPRGRRSSPPPPAEDSYVLTRAELREGIRAVFYPAVPASDENGQDRIDRATDRLLAAMGR